MQAVEFKNNALAFTEKPVPEVQDGEVLLRTLAAGICNTDIELFEGYYAFEGVAGHEFVGVVERWPGRPELEGRRAVSEINCGCGRCRWCLSGSARHCPSRKAIGIKSWDGAFAHYVKAPAANVHLLDDAIRDEEAVFTEPLAAALEITRQIHLISSDRVLVLGDGKLGLLIALALRYHAPNLTLAGRHPEKLSIAEKQGVAVFHTRDSGDLDDLCGETGHFDVVVDATGSEEGMKDALACVRPEGVVVAKTTSRRSSAFDLAGIVVNEIRLVGSRCGDFAPALLFLKNRLVDVRPLVEAVYPFRDFPKAFEHARRPGALKVLVAFENQGSFTVQNSSRSQ